MTRLASYGESCALTGPDDSSPPCSNTVPIESEASRSTATFMKIGTESEQRITLSSSNGQA